MIQSNCDIQSDCHPLFHLKSLLYLDNRIFLKSLMLCVGLGLLTSPVFAQEKEAPKTPKSTPKSSPKEKVKEQKKTQKVEKKTPPKVKAKESTSASASVKNSPSKASNQKTTSTGKLKIQFKETIQGLTFTFSTSNQSPLNLNAFSVQRDARNYRLVVKVDGVNAQRKWLKKRKRNSGWKSKKVDRALMYQSKSSSRSILKVRMKQKIPTSVFKKKTVSTTSNGNVVIFLPWTGKLDRKSKSSKVKKTKVEDVQTAPVSEPTPPPPAPETPETQAEESAEEGVDFKWPEAPQDAKDIGAIYREIAKEHLDLAQKARPVPRILALPFMTGETLKLKYSPKLSTLLLDKEFIHRDQVIWINQDQVRAQAHHLLDGESDSNKKQEEILSLAQLSGADFILFGSLHEDLNQPSFVRMNTRLFSTDGFTLLNEIDYRLSREVMGQGIDQAIHPIYRKTSLWRSLIFPGMGHLYRNKKVKGWTYLTAATVFLIGATASSLAGWYATRDYQDESQALFTSHRREDANAHYDRANLLWIGLASLWATSMVDNYFEAEDEIQVDLTRLGSAFSPKQ